MKKYIILFLMSFLFIGCAANKAQNAGILSQSELVFIDEKPKSQKVYIKFTNTSQTSSNLDKKLALSLSQNGYSIIDDENLADTIIKINLNYFKKINLSNGSSPRIGVGLGSGFSNFGIGFGTSANIFDNTAYEAQISFFAKVKSLKDIKTYQTLFNYQSKEGSSFESALNELEEKVSNQILRYLNLWKNI